MRWTSISAMMAAAAILATPAFARADEKGRFRLMLEGEVEAPAPGDPDGTGTATIRVFEERLCYKLRVEMIEPATAAHIHEAPAGSAGPVVVPLDAPTGGRSSGCVAISQELAQDIISNPQDYYVNVHNAEYPGGALRAQLNM